MNIERKKEMKLELILTVQELEDLIEGLYDGADYQEELVEIAANNDLDATFHEKKRQSYRMLVNRIELAKDIHN